MVEGEDQHRQGEPEGAQEAAGIRHLAQRGGVPVRDEIERQAEEDAAQGVDQPLVEFEHEVLAHQDDGHQGRHQHAGKQQARRRGHLQLVDDEGFHRVGDAHGIDEQDGIDGEEIEQGDELACGKAEVFLHHGGDVAVGAGGGQHEAGQAPVGEIGHGAHQQGDDDQGPDAGHARIDGQEEDARAHRGAEEVEHPDDVEFRPAAGGGMAGFRGLCHEGSLKVKGLERQGNRSRARGRALCGASGSGGCRPCSCPGTEGAAFAGWTKTAPRERTAPDQHSTRLTARPPSLVSLNLAFISRPVSFMAMMTASRLTICCEDFSQVASRQAL